MSDKFRIDQIQYYVWALSQEWPSMPNGYDGKNGHKKLKKMADGYKSVVQASLNTLDKKIEHELELDARHQQYYWLWVDRAIEAIGMLEADGLDLANRGKIFAQHYYDAHKKASKKNAFISLVKPNIDIYKSQIRESNVVFEATPNAPDQDAQEIADFNAYSAEILNENNWEQAKENHIHDFASYGSGTLLTDYRMDEAVPDSMFFERRIEDGEVIDFEEYERYKRLIRAHVVQYIPTFEIIACRNAGGHGSWNIAGDPQHPYTHWVHQERVAKLKRKYPKHAKKIGAATSDIYRQTNPRSFVLDYNSEDQATVKTTWIRFPVQYNLTIPIRLANGEVVQKIDMRNRSAVCRVDRIEGVGIVDMELDPFAHNQLPIAQAVNFPSNKHSRGIGMCKYGYAPQKVHQIMFNGQLRMFERMVKGGGWFFKGVIDKKDIKEQQKEGTWIGIDRDSLPADLKNQPIKNLVAENNQLTFPNIYERMQAQTSNYINIAMSSPPPQKGFKSGTSGRQDMALISQANEVASGGVRNYETVMMPLGKQIHSNIVEFDGDRMNIEVMAQDPAAPNKKRSVILNQVIDEKVKFDPYAEGSDPMDKWTLMPTKIKNNLKSLKFSTQLSTRSILPTNPTERRLWMSDFIQRIQPLTETKRGIELLKWMVESGMGGLPNWETRIQAIEKSINEDRQFQAQMAQREQTREDQKQAFEQMVQKEELAQNLKRLQAMEDDDRRQSILEAIDLMIQASEEGNTMSAADVFQTFQSQLQQRRQQPSLTG